MCKTVLRGSHEVNSTRLGWYYRSHFILFFLPPHLFLAPSTIWRTSSAFLWNERTHEGTNQKRSHFQRETENSVLLPQRLDKLQLTFLKASVKTAMCHETVTEMFDRMCICGCISINIQTWFFFFFPLTRRRCAGCWRWAAPGRPGWRSPRSCCSSGCPGTVARTAGLLRRPWGRTPARTATSTCPPCPPPEAPPQNPWQKLRDAQTSRSKSSKVVVVLSEC